MRDTSRDREYDSRFDAAFQPGFDDTSADLPADPFGFDTPEVDRGGVEGGPSGGPAGPNARPPHPIVDRFVVALWIIGLALLAAGLAGFASSIGGFSYSGPDAPPVDYYIAIFFGQLAPSLITLGFATLVATVFLLAVRWERRR